MDVIWQNLEQRQWEYADEINHQKANLQNMCVQVQRDADQVVAKESALEVRQVAFEERNERIQMF